MCCMRFVYRIIFSLIRFMRLDEKGDKKMYKEALRPVWAEINLSNLDYNIKNIKATFCVGSESAKPK